MAFSGGKSEILMYCRLVIHRLNDGFHTSIKTLVTRQNDSTMRETSTVVVFRKCLRYRNMTWPLIEISVFSLVLNSAFITYSTL